MTIEATIQIWREAGQYIAHAMPIDVMSSGPTPEQARLAVDEAVRLFIQTAKDAGTLDDVLAECGYEQNSDGWTSPEFVAVERHRLAVAG